MRAQCVYNKFFVINIDVVRNSFDQPLRALEEILHCIFCSLCLLSVLDGQLKLIYELGVTILCGIFVEFYEQSFVWSTHEVSNLKNIINWTQSETLIVAADFDLGIIHVATLSRGLMVAKVLSCEARGHPRLVPSVLSIH